MRATLTGGLTAAIAMDNPCCGCKLVLIGAAFGNPQSIQALFAISVDQGA